MLFAYDALAASMCGFRAASSIAASVGTVTVVLASGWELTSLAAAVIGGVSVAGGSGTVVGAALGAVVLAAIDNGLVLLSRPGILADVHPGHCDRRGGDVDVLIGAQSGDRFSRAGPGGRS